ncbi:MAG: NAD(P)H-quinone oxidoreductase [Anaeromyxobacteraceae bacterium]
MKAVVFGGKGGPELATIQEIPEPRAERGEVLVRVRAAALNRADLLQRRGLYPPPPGYREDVPGLEFAGEVAALGAGVTGWKVGDRVMAITAGEAQAEYVIADPFMLLRIPDGMSFADAACIPEAGITAHDAMVTLGGLRPGWTVLLHAIGSGVATMGLQIATSMGCTIIGTARTADKIEKAKGLGLHHAILLGKEDPKFADEVKRLTGRKGAPVIVDFVGAPYMAENLASLAPQGAIVVVGTMGGPKAQVDLGVLMRARGRVVGTVLRPRPLFEKIQATQAFARDVMPLVAAGKVKPVLDRAWPADRVREAHEQLERNDSFGKVVLEF